MLVTATLRVNEGREPLVFRLIRIFRDPKKAEELGDVRWNRAVLLDGQEKVGSKLDAANALAKLCKETEYRKVRKEAVKALAAGLKEAMNEWRAAAYLYHAAPSRTVVCCIENIAKCGKNAGPALPVLFGVLGDSLSASGGSAEALSKAAYRALEDIGNASPGLKAKIDGELGAFKEYRRTRPGGIE